MLPKITFPVGEIILWSALTPMALLFGLQPNIQPAIGIGVPVLSTMNYLALAIILRHKLPISKQYPKDKIKLTYLGHGVMATRLLYWLRKLVLSIVIRLMELPTMLTVHSVTVTK